MSNKKYLLHLTFIFCLPVLSYGTYEVKKVASGVYIYQLHTEDYINAKKMILLK